MPVAPDETRPTPGAQPNTVQGIISAVAQEYGIPPDLALAIAYHESGFSPTAVGDNGTSFGLFQLHQGGELGNNTAQWAYNPWNNARTAIAVIAQQYKAHPDWSWGRIAAAAQRPKYRDAYAATIDGLTAGHKFDAGGKPDYTGVYNDQQAQRAAQVFGPNSDVTAIITQAAQEHWSQQKLDDALRTTTWYQTHADASRAWSQLQIQDPAEAQRQIDEATTSLRAQAQREGLPISNAQLAAFAQQSKANGWTSDETNYALARQFQFNPKATYGGQIGKDVTSFRAMAGDWGVPISDNSIGQWEQAVLGAGLSPQDFQSYLQSQAKTLYPALAKYIDQGITVRQYADPYAQIASQELGINPTAFNLTDPKWQAPLMQIDPKTKERVPMTLDAWRSTIRSNPTYGYDTTTNGKQAAAQLTTQLANSFGAM